MWTHRLPSAQVASALCLQTECDFDVDSITVLQAQAHLSQNYENLLALAKVMRFGQEMPIAKHVAYVLIPRCFQGEKIE